MGGCDLYARSWYLPKIRSGIIWLARHLRPQRSAKAMAYRRKQPATRVSTDEETRSLSEGTSPASETPASLAARAIRASAAHRDASSLSSAYDESAVSSPRAEAHRMRSSLPSQRVSSSPYESISLPYPWARFYFYFWVYRHHIGIEFCKFHLKFCQCLCVY